MKNKQPNPSKLLTRLDITIPLVGLYDAPDITPFQPLIKPGKSDCIFKFYENWKKGETLHITKNHYGCGGAGRWMCGIEMREREDFLAFLVDGEGLKASRELMGQWIDKSKPYKADFDNMLIGPLKNNQWVYLKSVIFFVNPDQLSALIIGAQYHSSPNDPPATIAPFGSGCSLLLPFKDLNIPQSALGTTDIAMREHIPPDILSFSVTRSMLTQLCELDERSFLYKPFLKRLRKARGLPDM